MITSDNGHRAYAGRSRQVVHGLFDSLLRSGLSVRLRATGACMRPYLEGGETLVIDPLGRHPRPGVGEIVFYLDRVGHAAIHRVIRMEDRAGRTYVHTMADGRAACDPPVPIEDVTGRVRLVERAGSDAGMDLATPYRRIEGWMIALRLMLRCARVDLVACCRRALRRLLGLRPGQA